MDLDSALARCLTLPGAVETYPFGDEVAVIKVAGRMFALLPLGATPANVSLKCDPDLATALRARKTERIGGKTGGGRPAKYLLTSFARCASCRRSAVAARWGGPKGGYSYAYRCAGRAFA